MHHAPAAATALEFLPPPSRSHYNPHPSSTYHQTGWPRSLFPPSINAPPAYRTSSSSPPEASWRTGTTTVTRAPAADRQRWQQYPSNLPAPSTSIGGRLPTPPADDMSIYQPQQNNSNGNNNGSRQGNAFPSIASYHHQTSATTQAYPYNYPSRAVEATRLPDSVAQPFQQHYDGSSQSLRGTSAMAERIHEDAVQKKDAIHPNMQIPASVNSSGGSIGELAAQLTCLFWFETTDTLRKAEDWTPNSSPIQRLARDAIPTGGFLKWVLTILSTTQVTPNVILLALLFIYRLKTLNPTVKGKAGSEYRLLTVALMLGNKFLDDNTYTNKTWAEVSGISVGEIHVMEVEFLSNMRYSLLASKEQWAEWQTKLGKFADYFARASKIPLLPSPVGSSFPPAFLPSPSSTQSHSPALSAIPANSASFEYNQQYHPHYPPALALPQTGPTCKKRPFDDIWAEPPPKRAATISVSQMPTATLPSTQVPSQRQNMPRLPVPSLSISTSSSMGYPTFPQTLPPLPPLNGRAMSQVYPVTPGWTPQPQMSLPPTGPPPPQPPFSLPGSNQGTPSRRHSPRSMGVHSMNSSPISGIFPHDLNSPSIFLQQRNSPYKPVRLPNTLLYPPPQRDFHPVEHVQGLGPMQMHYQPLGKRNECRPGVVPEYVGATAMAWQQWPPLLQPVFHASV